MRYVVIGLWLRIKHLRDIIQSVRGYKVNFDNNSSNINKQGIGEIMQFSRNQGSEIIRFSQM